MGIKGKRVNFTFDESSFHTAKEPQGYVPRESPRITDVLLMDGRTVRIPPVQRFEEQPMSDKVMVDRAKLEELQGALRNLSISALEDNEMELHEALVPLDVLAHALAPAPAASSGAEAGVLDRTLETDDLGNMTMREFFAALLTTLLREGENFNGKKPFGNSGWQWELYIALWQAGLIEGEDDGSYIIIPRDQRHKADGLLPALVRQALSLPVAPAPAGAE